MIINLNLAPNETFSDALTSFFLLFQPWRWQRGKELQKIKNVILRTYLKVSRYKFHVSLFLSGRSALYYLLKSLNLKEGDEILIQAFTCEAVILPILALKLKPVFVDIEKQSFSINPIDLEKKLSKKSKAIILQHTFGIKPSQREKILYIIREKNLLLIEDIAHGIETSNIKIEDMKSRNHFFLLSFGRSKSVSSVFGGAIVTNQRKVAKKLNSFNLPYPSYSLILKLLIYKPIVFIIKITYNIYLGRIIHFLSQKFNLLIPEITKKEKAGQYDNFFDKKYPNALAILLLNQLKRFKKIQNQRKKIVDLYVSHFKNISLSTSCVSTAVIRFPLLINKRDKILQDLAKKGMFLGRWYDNPIAPRDFPLIKVGYRWGSCPKAEEICRKIINLPTNNIKLKEAERLINTLNDVIYENQNH